MEKIKWRLLTFQILKLTKTQGSRKVFEGCSYLMFLIFNLGDVICHMVQWKSQKFYQAIKCGQYQRS